MAKLEKSDIFGGTEGVFSRTVFDLQAPRAYRTIHTSNLKHIRDGFTMGRGSGLCLPTMLAKPFYLVGILDDESRGEELVQRGICPRVRTSGSFSFIIRYNVSTTFFEVDTIF